MSVQNLNLLFQYRQLHFTCILLYKSSGDKYTGQWDGYRKGQGEICYNDATKYTGHWHLPCRHGLGTLYSADGQELNQGKSKNDKYIGKE